MPDPHVIRLRGPWEYEALVRCAAAAAGATDESAAPLPPAGRVHMPADWRDTLGGDFRGRVRYRRRFNRPTGLEPRERVWLVIEGAPACGTYTVNGRPLGALAGDARAAESDVTDLLSAGNVLEIEVELPPPPSAPDAGNEQPAGAAIGEVRLEIRGPA